MMRRFKGSRGEEGQSLIQLMLTVAVLGVLGMLTTRLIEKVFVNWVRGKAALEAHQGSRISRDMIVSSLRNASLSSVVITRADQQQPPLSKICMVDTVGNSLTYFQKGRRLYRGTWSGVTSTVLSQTELMRDNVERFNVYYPDVKNPNQIGFSLMIKVKTMRRGVEDVELLTTGDVEIKAP